MSRVLLALVGALGVSAASAEDAGGCAKFKWSIARERAAFAAADLPSLAPGQTLPALPGAALLKLSPQSGVTFVRPPGKPPKASPAFAAVLPTIPVATAGTYQVTLSDEAWVDVVQNGREIRSSGFSGQPDCPGVRKSVRFSLGAAPITLQISGAARDDIKVEIAPAE